MSEHVYSKSDFDYELPPDLIALRPVSERSSSRLLFVDDSMFAHCTFSDLPHFLRAGDVLVLNDTKVIPARLNGVKDSGGRVEILVERIEEDRVALCHVRASRGLQPGHRVKIGDYSVRMEARVGDLYRLVFEKSVSEVLGESGVVPLPPYINRPPEPSDVDRYQTVFAKQKGAVAAPTAGLHFDHSLLDRIRELGVSVEFLTLHVGAGTFQPLRDEQLSAVRLHLERYAITESTLETIRSRKGRCIAVGTTVVRTLEHVARTNRLGGETDLFIRPGFEFREVDVLVTNFHLPQSTLLMLVSAFCGYEQTMAAYEVAVKNQYRFYSYGDAMWCTRREV